MIVSETVSGRVSCETFKVPEKLFLKTRRGPNNCALACLKTYPMDQSYIGRWIVRLDGYYRVIEHRIRYKHQNADSLSKKTEFYERLEEKQADKAEIKDFHF